MSGAPSLDGVKAQVHRIVGRPRGKKDPPLEVPAETLDALLAEVREQPIWTVSPSVFRVALIDTGGPVAPYWDNVVLPAARHDLPLALEMLNHIRAAKGLGAVTMPLFVQPDEIAFALANPAECHCDETREVEARARSWRRLGRRGSKRWLYTGQDALDRDGRACTRCGAKKDLHVHWTGAGNGKWTNKDNYVTLCRRCHVLEDGRSSEAAEALRFHLDGAEVAGTAIRSQLALVFQKRKLAWVAVALGREYVVLAA